MIIYNGKEIVVNFLRGESKYFVVTFMCGGRTEFAENEFFMCQIQEKLKINLIGVSTKIGGWYLSNEMDVVIDLINSITRNKKVIVCGTSMGGYGSLKYSRRLNSYFTLACAPQWSLNPNDLKDIYNDKDKYKFGENILFKNENMKIKQEDLNENVVILYDPYDKYDSYHAQKILSQGNIREIYTYYSGHGVMDSISGSETMKNILNCASNNDYYGLRWIISNARRHHINNIFERVSNNIEKKPKLSLKMITSRSFSSVRNNKKFFYNQSLVGRLLYKAYFYNLKQDAEKLLIKSINAYGVDKEKIKKKDFILISSCGKIITYDIKNKSLTAEEDIFFPKNYPVFCSHQYNFVPYIRLFRRKMFLFESDGYIHMERNIDGIYNKDYLKSFFSNQIDSCGSSTFFLNFKVKSGFMTVNRPYGEILYGAQNAQLWESFVLVPSLF
ncbi:hypothetical protein AA0313_2589 [Acetobacter indonesiensis NRIC 0313]|uniref:Uncharacterized protein n=1 Tax=Acetobacter indonesiensis TaxID=104101 RepID=A0A6N3T6H5_9PROT|nr:hypothetical protein [Acetobacter indonesiensis]GAN64536.1 hypothetical protein Abin_082_001 [Acetobacter indonesiensis]GBQ61040.1 hypothetical protein AA0313_2589 [Acetobacter indonesiensis NRIC 0313]GEN04931.1 hypothetical protein AIN02nite_29560 [Acetobacter indonesiensis]